MAKPTLTACHCETRSLGRCNLRAGMETISTMFFCAP
jgi:hypothetical protein